MNDEAAFIAALAADPDDRTTALVFADWLDDRGDPRGPLMRIEEVRAWMAPTYENPIPKLLKALETGKGVTEATKLLARIGEDTVPGLVALLSHETELVRLRAVKALRLMGPRAKAAVPVLTEIVKGSDKRDAGVRHEAVKLLGVLKAKGAAKDELAKGLDSADPAERLAAVEAMAQLRTKTAGGALCAALADSSVEVRRAAVGQLRYIASPPMAPFAVEPLRKSLADPDDAIPRFAVTALGKIGPKAAAAIPDLIRRFNGATGSDRTSALEALVQIGTGTPEVLEVVLAALRAPGTQHQASLALCEWPALPPAAVPALREFVRNPNSGTPYGDGQLVRKGLFALARVTPTTPEVLDELRSRLSGEHSSAAAQALGELGPAAAPAVPALVKLLNKKGSQFAPFDVAKALAKIGGEGITALVEALDAESGASSRIADAAASGLKEAGPAARAALPALLARLRRKEGAHSRALVVGAIAALGADAHEAIPDLVAAALDGSGQGYEYMAVFEALRSFGPVVLPFAGQLAAALNKPDRSAIHEETVGLLAALVPHGFDGLPVFREVLRRLAAGDFYASEGDYYRRRVAGAAVAGLAAIGPAAEEAIPDLQRAEEAFRLPYSSDVLEKVLAAYGAIGGAAVPLIRAFLTHSLRDVRLAAIRALVASGDESMESREALRKLETDGVRIVRATATSALQKLGTPKRKRK